MKYNFIIKDNKKIMITKDLKTVEITPIKGDQVESGPGTGVVESNPNTIITNFDNKIDAINFAISNLDKESIKKAEKINIKYDRIKEPIKVKEDIQEKIENLKKKKETTKQTRGQRLADMKKNKNVNAKKDCK